MCIRDRPLQCDLLCVKYRTVLTDAGIVLFAVFDGFAGADKARADAAAHALFQRDFACNTEFLCKGDNAAQHAVRAAGTDQICAASLETAAEWTRYKAFFTGGAVVGAENDLSTGTFELLL